MFFDSILFIDCYLSDANRKRLVSHFANMVYIGVVADVLTIDRYKTSSLSVTLISSILYLIALCNLS